jgi:AcrR family transcriptional regulator
VARDKAARILDAAEELLVGFGYRRVTVDDVARRAGVGKGTVYLYWPSKRELFAGVLTREAAGLLGEQLAALRADSAEVQLHRSLR